MKEISIGKLRIKSLSSEYENIYYDVLHPEKGCVQKFHTEGEIILYEGFDGIQTTLVGDQLLIVDDVSLGRWFTTSLHIEPNTIRVTENVFDGREIIKISLHRINPSK